MKKLTILIALLCSISAFSTRYLVQKNGTNLWNGNATGTIVTLGASQTLSAWFSANYSTFVAGSDEIWLATGTYVTDGTITVKNGVNLYGGFAGTESAVSARSKGSSGNAWEFTNTTTIDGNNASRQGIITGPGTITSYIDGITLTKYNITGAAANVTGVGVQLNAYWTMQNCIVTANTFTNSGTSQCRGGGVYIKGGQLLNSNINNNSATKGTTGSGSTYGGGVAFSYNASPVTTVKGCTIENNTSTVTGGGMAILDGTGGTIEDCIFKLNNSAAGSGGGIGASNAAAANGTLSIKNCQFIENTAATGNGGAMNLDLSTTSPASTTIDGCLFSGNSALTQGGAVSANAGIFAGIKNCIFRDNKVTATSGNNATSAFYYGAAAANYTTVSNCIFANNSTATNTTNGNNTIKFYNAGNNLYNCTIVNNSNPGVYTNSTATGGNALNFNGATGAITNCIFWGNSGGAGTFVGISTGVVTTTNATDNVDISGKTNSNNIKTLTSPYTNNNTFTSPTQFAGVSTDVTTKSAVANADWTLKSGCPAIDAGTNTSITPDLAGNGRPYSTAYDMGAYEFGYTAQTITFGALSAVNYGDALSLSASGGASGNPVTYTSSNTGVATISGSTVTIVGKGSTNITASQAGNSSYSAATSVTQQLNVNAKAITITANSVNKTYGSTQTTPVIGSSAFTPTGLVGSENIGSVTLTYGTGALAATDAAGNTSTITPSAATGGTFNRGNYTITYATGTLTVAQKTLTLTGASATSKTYTGTNAAVVSSTVNGTVNSDVITCTTGTFASVNVANNIPVTCILSGLMAGNYTLTQSGITANITAAPLTITGISGVNKVYTGTNSATLTGTAAYSGLVNGETSTVTGTASATF
ncbi:MAG: YDG domain-containing protein, partial [Paludibacter sp.]